MIGSRSSRTLSLLLLALLVAVPASAQDYKEAFNAGLAAAGAKKYTEALKQFTLAANGAKAEGDNDVLGKSNRVIGQIEYNLGLAETRKEAYQAALGHFENGITRYPTYAKNYLGKGLALKKLDKIDEAMAAFKKTMEVGNANADRQTARKGEEAIREHWVYLASSTLSRTTGGANARDGEEALGYLAKSNEYVEADADVLYYTAVAQRAKGNNEAAVEAADKAIEMHRGSATDKAKIYFVKGEAMMSLGNVPGAKEAFQKASVGSYRASAQHFLELLGTN